MLHEKQKGNFASILYLAVSAFVCSQFLFSCINNIPEEAPEPGDIPICLSTSIKNNLFPTPNGFEEGEAIGLYIMVQPSTINKTRYIDNVKLTNKLSEGFIPEEEIFFPEGNTLCDFTSYFPYQKAAINKGESGIQIEVQANQSDIKALSSSDFRTAITSGIKPSKDPVKLTFDHKLSLINIRLKALSGYTPEMLLEANPTVRIKDVYTKATYDFITDNFTDLNTKADIIPHGTWTIENEMLCGKSAIIIPQSLPESHILIELYVEERLFECKLDKEYILISGTADDNTISLVSSSDAVKNTITTSVNGWNTRENDMEAVETGTMIQVSKLDFSASNVLKVLNKEKQVAEICLEYLCTEDLECQAVVIYPMLNGKTDLTQGMVLEVKDEILNKHGGSVVWNKTTNSLIYSEGTSAIAKYIYVTENGEIKTSRPLNALQLQLKPDLLIDNRGTESNIYPIAKIATQYWIIKNFKAKKYIDGSDIEYGGAGLSSGGAIVNNSNAQYYDLSNTYMYYNTACVATGNLIPYGWRVGNETDFTRLKTYIKDNAAVLKNGTSWRNNTYGITNLTGFNAIAGGYFNKKLMYNKDISAYWCANNESANDVGKMFQLNVDNNKTVINTTTTDMALNIKCIRN